MRTCRFAAAVLLAVGLLTGALLAASPARAQSDDELKALNTQVANLYRAGKYAEAVPIAQRALALAEQRHGADHPQFAGTLTTLGTVYRTQGKYADAEPLYKRALAIFEKSLGPENVNVAVALNELAQLYNLQGRLADAEPLIKRAIDIEEKIFGPDHPEVATLLNNLAALYRSQGKYGLAESLRKRTIDIYEKARGPDHPDVAIALDNLAVLYQSQGRHELAEPLTKRALAILEKTLGPDHPDVAISLNNLAAIYIELRKYALAEPLFKRSLAINEPALGSDHLEIAKTLDNLAGLYRIQGKYDLAQPAYKRALAIFEANLGPDHPDVGVFFSNLGGFYFDQRDWATSIEYLRKATGVFIRRTQRGLDTVGQTLTGGSRKDSAGDRLAFIRLVKAAHGLAAGDPRGAAQLSGEAFVAAQGAQASEAAASLAQMAVRSAAGNRSLALLVRERQDLLSAWQKRDGLLVWARSQPPDRRNARVDRLILADLAAIDQRMGEVDRQLKESFPQFTSLTSSDGLDLDEVKTWLKPDEALVLFLDTSESVPYLDLATAKPIPEETFVWVVTKTDVRWVRSELGTEALAARVAALRCGLDHTLWQGAESAQRCRKALGASPSAEEVGGQKVQVLPFDPARAHELYKALLGPVEDLIRGKHLLVVPSGPLTSLPFNVLVTEAPKITVQAPPTGRRVGATLASYRKAAWLGTRQAITVLPSVASLKSLRQFAKASRASKPYLGIGNPLLDGQQDHPDWGAHYKKQAQAARDRQTCPKALDERVALAAGRPLAGFARLFRGGNADIEQVRELSPLPETADELCAVAHRLGVPESELLLGGRATETMLKDLSEQARLAEYAILHFATHGALTGQVQGAAGPGLILTPPPKGTSDLRALERDDGYLAASEIAALKLDADWVILSACNTAGGAGESAEALSGLARAFFYAGARALLVSHWEVGSHAAVKLTTRAFAELKAKPAIGRAEAMQVSMRELIDKGTAAEAHPSQWAPFVLVGEGGAAPQVAELQMPPSAPKNQKGLPAKTSKRAIPPDWRTQIWKQ